MKIAHAILKMSFYEAIIIYLAIGAPFAVKAFLNNRKLHSVRLWSIASTAMVLWFPTLLIDSIRSLLRYDDASDFAEGSAIDSQIGGMIQDILAVFGENRGRDDLWVTTEDLREVLDRYTTLTQLSRLTNVQSQQHDREIFRISGHENEDVATICLRRQKLRRLATHQTRAGFDVVELYKRLVNGPEPHWHIADKIAEVVSMLDDFSTSCALANETRRIAQEAASAGFNGIQAPFFPSRNGKGVSAAATTDNL